jgi:hypothetical protein
MRGAHAKRARGAEVERAGTCMVGLKNLRVRPTGKRNPIAGRVQAGGGGGGMRDRERRKGGQPTQTSSDSRVRCPKRHEDRRVSHELGDVDNSWVGGRLIGKWRIKRRSAIGVVKV